jgi:hypothetical protein
MATTAIQIMRPNVTQEDAFRAFSSSGPSSLYWRWKSGPLQRIADVYVPFRLFRVEYQLTKAPHSRLFALDAVHGSLDLFEFPKVPAVEQLKVIETRNFVLPTLAEDRAEQILREKVWRIIFQQGFFKVREPKLDIFFEPTELYLPYWLGLYNGPTGVRCRVMDAVRRRMEGAKASLFFEEWLAA